MMFIGNGVTMIFFIIFLFATSVYADVFDDKTAYFKMLKPEFKSISFISNQQNFILGDEMDALNECVSDYFLSSSKIKEYEKRHYIYEFIRSEDGRYILFYITSNNKKVLKDNLPAYMGGDAFYLYDLKDMKLLTRQPLR